MMQKEERRDKGCEVLQASRGVGSTHRWKIDLGQKQEESLCRTKVSIQVKRWEVFGSFSPMASVFP